MCYKSEGNSAWGVYEDLNNNTRVEVSFIQEFNLKERQQYI